MKKILVSTILFIGIFIFQINNINYLHAACEYTIGEDITKMVEGCMDKTGVVAVKEEGTIEGGFKTKIQNFTNNIALFLALLSVGSVIYGGLMMTLSVGEDEKIKKAKDIIIWALAGLLGVVLATTIVTLVINVIYGLS